jgi:hypothetical protein
MLLPDSRTIRRPGLSSRIQDIGTNSCSQPAGTNQVHLRCQLSTGSARDISADGVGRSQISKHTDAMIAPRERIVDSSHTSGYSERRSLFSIRTVCFPSSSLLAGQGSFESAGFRELVTRLRFPRVWRALSRSIDACVISSASGAGHVSLHDWGRMCSIVSFLRVT